MAAAHRLYKRPSISKTPNYPSQISTVVISRKLPQSRPLLGGADFVNGLISMLSTSAVLLRVYRELLLTTWNLTYRNLEIVCTKFLSKKADQMRRDVYSKRHPRAEFSWKTTSRKQPRFTVKSPETHLARNQSYVARNSSRLFRLTIASVLKERDLFTQLSRLFCLIIA